MTRSRHRDNFDVRVLPDPAARRVTITVRDFCPKSGYRRDLSDAELDAIAPCQPTENGACREHGYDPA